MKLNLLLSIILPVFACCQTGGTSPAPLPVLAPTTVGSIPPPAGYKRMAYDDASFAYWLRQLPLKKDNQVHLYNGALKRNQAAQYAVLDVPVGNKNLQQCADAVMRLRAAYFYSHKNYSAIVFSDNSGKKYTCPPGVDSTGFQQYLERVFTACGTLSLQKQLKPVPALQQIEPGYVFIKGGSPGHAVMVVDVAVNEAGKKMYLLAQSYMPAQDLHILKNPVQSAMSPWYLADDANALIYTPEWVFSTAQLRKW